MDIHAIQLKPSAVARALGAAALLVVLLSTAFQAVKYLTGHNELMGLLAFTYVDDEQNLPTLFSVLLLALASLCLVFACVLARKQKSPDSWRWALLALGFLYLAFDEGLSLHEKLGPMIRAVLGRGEESESSTTYWWIRGLVAAGVLMLLFWGFLRRLPARTRFHFLLGGALYLVGAVVLDILGIKWADAHTEHNPTYVLLATVEESLEMAGVIVLIYGVLAYIAESCGEVRFQLGKSGEKARS